MYYTPLNVWYVAEYSRTCLFIRIVYVTSLQIEQLNGIYKMHNVYGQALNSISSFSLSEKLYFLLVQKIGRAVQHACGHQAKMVKKYIYIQEHDNNNKFSFVFFSHIYIFYEAKASFHYAYDIFKNSQNFRNVIKENISSATQVNS